MTIHWWRTDELLGQAIGLGFARIAPAQGLRDPVLVYQLLSFFFAGAFTVLYYWRVAHHMRRLSRLARQPGG